MASISTQTVDWNDRTAACRRTAAFKGLRVTLRGLIAMAVTGFILAAAFTAEANLLLLLFGISCGLMLYNLLACVRAVRKVEVGRTTVDAAVAGRPFQITYNLRNRRRWSRVWALRVNEAAPAERGIQTRGGFLMRLDPGCDASVELTAVCPRRGRVDLRAIRISCGFPFGLFDCHVDIQCPAELVVYPPVGRVRREFWPKQALAEGSGSRRLERGAGHDEFHGVREYRHGDSPRWIHWRRSAHTGQLVVREQRPIRDQQVVILLDPWPVEPATPPANRGLLERVLAVGSAGGVSAATRTGGHRAVAGVDTEVERVISAAATTVCDALDRGHRVGLICRAAFAAVIPPAGGRAQRRRLLRQLALLAPGAQMPLEDLLGAVRWLGNCNSRLMLFTSSSGQAHSRIVRVLAGRADTLLVSPQSGLLDKLFELAPDGEKRRAG